MTLMVIERKFLGEEVHELVKDGDEHIYVITEDYSGRVIDEDVLSYDLREAELEFERMFDRYEEDYYEELEKYGGEPDDSYYDVYDGLSETELRYNQ